MKVPADLRKAISFDLETAGVLREYALQPWRVRQKKAWISTYSSTICDGSGSPQHLNAVFPSRDDLRGILQLAIDQRRPVLGWNITFDIAWLLAYGLEDQVFAVKWIDGMRLWRHLRIEPEYDANRANKKTYRLKGPGGAIDTFAPIMNGYDDGIDYQAETPEELAKLLRYNDLDTLGAYIATQTIWSQLKPKQRVAAWIEMDMLPFVSQANLRGMNVDGKAVLAAWKHTSKVAEDMSAALAADGVTEAVLRSPKQLEVLMFDEWGLRPLKKTGAGARSTDKTTLHELAPFDPRAKMLRDWREAINLKTKFVQSITASVAYNEDGRVHPEAILFGTYSGRLTYTSTQGRNRDKRQTGFALHQMKNASMYRSMIVAPPGHSIIEVDAAGQEFKLMAILSGDPTMLQLCMPGEDPHSFMGSKIDPDPAHDYQWVMANKDGAAKLVRKGGKVANLSLQYRTSWRKLMTVARVQYDIPMTESEAQYNHSAYLATYFGVPVYWNRQIQRGMQLGYAETLAGRRVRVVGDWVRSNKNLWAMQSTMINYPVQGSGAEQKYLAISVLKSYLLAERVQFAFDLHDGLYFYVKTEKAEKVGRTIKAMLDNMPYERAWNFKPPVPLTFDLKIGPNWGALKEVQ